MDSLFENLSGYFIKSNDIISLLWIHGFGVHPLGKCYVFGISLSDRQVLIKIMVGFLIIPKYYHVAIVKKEHYKVLPFPSQPDQNDYLDGYTIFTISQSKLRIKGNP